MTATETRRVELHVRSLSGVQNPANEHLESLRNLADSDVIDLTVSVWGREIGLSRAAGETDAGQHVLDRVATFREWADERGVSVEPFFRTRQVQSSVTGEPYATLVLPVSCLAEYRDGKLAHVAPYTTGNAVHSVADHVRRLQSANDHRPERPTITPGP